MDRGFTDERSHRHDAHPRNYDVKHIKLALDVDPAVHHLSGTATLTIAPISPWLDSLSLDAAELTVESVSLSGAGTSGTLDYSMRGQKLIIRLPRRYRRGEVFKLAIAYNARPRIGLYFSGSDEANPGRPWQVWSQGEVVENRHWFPGFDALGDRFTTEMEVRVPAGYTAISNGRLVKKSSTSVSTTYHYRGDTPIPNYLVSLVVGQFALVEDVRHGIPLQYYVPEAYRDRIPAIFGETPDIMDFLVDLTGQPYPFEKYAQVTVQDFIYSGMENASATTLTMDILRDKNALLDRSAQALITHELAHQWYGDLLTPNNWKHLWLSEGLASYTEALYVEKVEGEFGYLKVLENSRQEYLDEFEEYFRPIVTPVYAHPDQLFDAHTYDKGAWVFHMLRRLIGTAAWQRGLHQYTADHAAGEVETNDLKQAMEDASGFDLDLFFEQWLYSPGHPQLEADWKWDRQASAVALTISQTQVEDGLSPLFSMPVDVALVWEGGADTVTVDMSRREETFLLSAPRPPYRVELDPEGDLLMELTFRKGQRELLGQLTEGGAMARRKAAEWLGAAAAKRVALALGEALRHDPYSIVREKAAAALGRMRTRTAREELFTGLSDSESSVRTATATALSRYRGDPKIAAALQEQYSSDSSYAVKAAIATGMARLKVKGSYDFVLTTLADSSHRQVIRDSAIVGLSMLKDPRGIDVLLEWGTTGRPSRVRRRAVAKLPSLAVIAPERREKIRLYLEGMAADKDFVVREKVLTALGDLGDRRSIPLLEQALEHEAHFTHRDAAWQSLQKLRRH